MLGGLRHPIPYCVPQLVSTIRNLGYLDAVNIFSPKNPSLKDNMELKIESYTTIITGYRDDTYSDDKSRR